MTHHSLITQWQSKLNEWDYIWRTHCPWDFGKVQEQPGKPVLTDTAQTCLSQLQAHYPIEDWSRHMSTSRLLENWNYLLWLDVIRPYLTTTFANPPETFRWLDVGAKNWSYVPALTRFMEAQKPANFVLDGVELDAYRRYRNLQTRKQTAEYYTQSLPQAHYHPGNILDWPHSANIITHFLPFLFPEPLLSWGLPLKLLQPEKILAHAINLLAPGGALIIINQGEAEADEQARLLHPFSDQVTITSMGCLPAPFLQYRYPRYGWLIQKRA